MIKRSEAVELLVCKLEGFKKGSESDILVYAQDILQELEELGMLPPHNPYKYGLVSEEDFKWEPE